MGKGDPFVKSAPPKTIEAVIGFLTPPACREHVLGDLHERYTSLGPYLADSISTVPLVVVSQVRRNTDTQVFLIEACVLYISFLAAACWWEGIPFLNERTGMLRVAIPSAVALFASVLASAYVTPGRPFFKPALAIAFAFLSQAAVWAANAELAAPHTTMIFGGGMSLLVLSTLHMLFPPRGSSLPGA